MYKGTFVAIAEVVGLYLAPPTSADGPAEHIDFEDAGGKAENGAAPVAVNGGRPRPGPWSFRTIGDRRLNE